MNDDDTDRIDAASTLTDSVLRMRETGKPGDRLRLLKDRQRPATYAGVRVDGHGWIHMECWDSKYNVRETYFGTACVWLKWHNDQRPIDIAQGATDIMRMIYTLLATDFHPIHTDRELVGIVNDPASSKAVKHTRTRTDDTDPFAET